MGRDSRVVDELRPLFFSLFVSSGSRSAGPARGKAESRLGGEVSAIIVERSVFRRSPRICNGHHHRSRVRERRAQTSWPAPVQGTREGAGYGAITPRRRSVGGGDPLHRPEGN